MPETEFAPAKINLALHITGQRADGYHLLDSLVVFAGVGDRIAVSPGTGGLTITGPQAAALPVSDDNLVLRAARLFTGHPVAIALEKHLPIASGIGGGSADAAATLRAVARLTGQPLPDAAQVLRLGADVPVCLTGRAARMSGVGEIVTPLATPLPPAWLVLVNPGRAVSTPAVFRALTSRDNPPLPEALPAFTSGAALAAFLQTQRNDMQPAAITLIPEIATVIEALAAQAGCQIARMSGSGATCFGLFTTEAAAQTAATTLRRQSPDWWIAPAPLLSQTPQLSSL